MLMIERAFENLKWHFDLKNKILFLNSVTKYVDQDSGLRIFLIRPVFDVGAPKQRVVTMRTDVDMMAVGTYNAKRTKN